MINNVGIFDCTLREVGYQTGWYFSDEFVKNLYKFASNDNKYYMEQDLNRIKLVLVEKKKTGKWQPQEIGVSECTMSRWTSNKAQPNLSFMPLQNCLVSK